MLGIGFLAIQAAIKFQLRIHISPHHRSFPNDLPDAYGAELIYALPAEKALGLRHTRRRLIKISFISPAPGSSEWKRDFHRGGNERVLPFLIAGD